MAEPALDRLACLAGRSWRVSELPGGLTNHNVRVVTVDDGPRLDLVVRCAQSDAALLGIDRDAEHTNTRAAAEAGVGPPVHEYRPDLGMLVVGHLDARTLTDEDFADPEVLVRAASACRRLHAGPRFSGVFDMVALQREYRATVRDRGFWLPPTYDDHAGAWSEVAAALAVDPPPSVPCNNDLLAANFLDDGERVWLIDYEYSGMGDAAFELGNTVTECGFADEQVDAWVEAYAGAEATRAFAARVRLQALASQYGWSLWGFIQAEASPQDFDFRSWGTERFAKAEATFRGPQLPRLLEELADG